MSLNEFDNIDENVKGWLQQVLDNRIVKPDQTKKYCKRLLHFGIDNNDARILGFAYFYLAEAYFTENGDDKFIKYLLLGLPYMQDMSMKQLLARAYNLLGSNAHNHDNLTTALDYYVISLNYCKEADLSYEAGLANTNIGQIYYLLHDFQTAITYYKKARQCYNKDRKNKFYMRNISMLEMLICNSYFYMKKINLAMPYFRRIEEKRDEYLKDTYSRLSIYVFETMYFNAQGNTAKRDEMIRMIFDNLHEANPFLRFFNDANALCEILIEIGDYKKAGYLLDQMDKSIKDTNFSNMKQSMLKMKLNYYTAIHDEASFNRVSSEFYRISEKLEHENMVKTKETIELRMDLEHIKKKHLLIQEENRILVKKSETDALSRLPNREKLNTYSDEAFERAYHNQTSLAVEILDIDWFKEYNDTYGHQAGDECLIQISKLLKKMIRKDIFCARYGGDEFLIIYENMTDKEILEYAEKLKQDVIDLNIENKNSGEYQYITISQGIRNSVPRTGNKVWDYLYVADTCLYRMKRQKKNDICLVHTAKELGISLEKPSRGGETI